MKPNSTIIKGVCKNMVVLKQPGGSIFEEAYFVLRDPSKKEISTDMVAEANRILAEHIVCPEDAVFTRRKARREWAFRLLFGITGLIMGSGILLIFHG